jgi:hypothetical protein
MGLSFFDETWTLNEGECPEQIDNKNLQKSEENEKFKQ